MRCADYVPSPWWSVLPPPPMYSCSCVPQPLGYHNDDDRQYIMKRRDFLRILGIGTASVAFGLPSLATELTPAQAEEAIARGDQFSVFHGFYGHGTLENGRGQIPLTCRKVYTVRYCGFLQIGVDEQMWYQEMNGERFGPAMYRVLDRSALPFAMAEKC